MYSKPVSFFKCKTFALFRARPTQGGGEEAGLRHPPPGARGGGVQRQGQEEGGLAVDAEVSAGDQHLHPAREEIRLLQVFFLVFLDRICSCFVYYCLFECHECIFFSSLRQPFENWEVLTMELWGEEARGEWTLEVQHSTAQHSTAKPHLGRTNHTFGRYSWRKYMYVFFPPQIF